MKSHPKSSAVSLDNFVHLIGSVYPTFSLMPNITTSSTTPTMLVFVSLYFSPLIDFKFKVIYMSVINNFKNFQFFIKTRSGSEDEVVPSYMHHEASKALSQPSHISHEVNLFDLLELLQVTNLIFALFITSVSEKILL